MSNNSSKKMAIAIDGNSLSYRAYYATISYAKKYLETNPMQPTNAVKLMLLMCLKLLRATRYQFCLVAFDTHAPTFRKLASADYKSNRKKMPDLLVSQIPLIIESLRYAGFNVMYVDGWEADDLIGSFAKLMCENNIHTNIFSSDHDLLQLVNESTSVCMPIKGVSEIQEYNMENFSKLFYGLTPNQVPYFKALAGDTSDNYAGVKGIGKKGACELLLKYKTLDGIFENSLKLNKKQYMLLSQQLVNLKLCLELSLIRCDYFQTETKINDFALHPLNVGAMNEFVKKYSIYGLEKYF